MTTISNGRSSKSYTFYPGSIYGAPYTTVEIYADGVMKESERYNYWGDLMYHYYHSADTDTLISSSYNYSYSGSGLVTKTIINGFETNYTYDSTYGLPLTKTYSPDGTNTIKETYTLTYDKKNIATKTVKNGSSEYEKYIYTYDSHGCLTQERRYSSYSSYALTTNSYTSGGQLASTTTSGVTNSFTYDSMGRVLTETDGNGNVTTYTYDAHGRTTSITHPDQSSVSYVYNVGDGINNTTVTDESGKVTVYNYDLLGNINEVSVGNTVLESYTYDEYCRKISYIDLLQRTEYTYDKLDNLIDTKIYALGETETPLYHESYDPVSEITSSYRKALKTVYGDSNCPDIISVEYYDRADRIIKEGYVTDSGEILTQYTYDIGGRRITELSQADANRGYSYTKKYYYDHAGRVTATVNAIGNYDYCYYDYLGNKTSERNGSVQSGYTYDSLGRMITKYFYVESLDVTATQNITSYTYDNNGNVLTETVKNDSGTVFSKTAYTYDSRNRLTQTMGYTSSEASITLSSYTYDDCGRMLTATNAGYTTTYTYDSFGNLTTITYPDGGQETFTYSADGRMLSKTDRSGNIFTYTYTPMGKLASEVCGQSSKQYEYSSTGALISITSDDDYIEYGYDEFGRKVRETTELGETLYSYDTSGNLISLTVDAFISTTTSYTYDRLNRLIKVETGSFKTEYTYDSYSRRTSTQNYYNNALSTETNYTYNIAGYVKSVVNKNSSGTVLSSFNYVYREDGNILRETDINGVTTNYTYDLLGRLTSEVSSQHSRYYTYDNAGNRTQAIVDSTTIIGYTYNSAGLLISHLENNGSTSKTINYVYDASGNLISKAEGINTNTYTFDVWGNMTAADDTSYGYDPTGLRNSKDNKDFVNANGQVVLEIIGNTTNTYSYGIERISMNNNKLYLYDGHGNVVQITDSLGTVTKTYDYDAYGIEYARDLGDSNPFRFCGEYYDVETGFIYLRARYYDSEIGRFISKDTHWNTHNSIYGDDKDNKTPDLAAIKQSGNPYLYCMDDPLKYYDKDGYLSLPNWAKVAIGVAATAAAVAVTFATGGATAPVLVGVAASTIIGASTKAIEYRVTEGSWEGSLQAAADGAIDGFMWGGLCAFGGSLISGTMRMLNYAKRGITIGKSGTYNKVAEIAKIKHYKGMKEFNFIKALFGEKVAEEIGWWQNKSIIKIIMFLKGAIYDSSGELTGAYAKEVALTKGYEFLYNVWLM